MGKVVLENGKQVKVPLLPFTMNGQRFGVRQMCQKWVKIPLKCLPL